MKNVQKNRVPFLLVTLLVIALFAGWHHLKDVDFISVSSVTKANDTQQNDNDTIATSVVAAPVDSSVVVESPKVSIDHSYSNISTLVVADFVADVKIIPWTQKTVKVVLAGPQKGVNEITLTEDDSNLFVNGSAMKDDRLAIDVTVYVPMYTGITVEGETSKVDIGNIQGVLAVDVRGGLITAGIMQAVDIQATDKAHVVVASATSSLYVDADQQSHVEILGGNVHRAKLMATNKSSIAFDGIATNAHSRRDKISTITIAKATDISVTGVNDDWSKVGFSQ